MRQNGISEYRAELMAISMLAILLDAFKGIVWRLRFRPRRSVVSGWGGRVPFLVGFRTVLFRDEVRQSSAVLFQAF